MTNPEGGIQARLDEMERRLHEVWARASGGVAEGFIRAEPALEAMGSAVENLHIAAKEVGSAAQAVQAERLRYEELFQLAPDGYLVTDERGTIVEANQAAGELLSSDPAALFGAPLVRFVAPGQQDRMSVLQKHARRRGAALIPADDIEVIADEGVRLLNVRCRAARDLRGATVGYRWALHDLSDRIFAERLAREAQAVETARLRDLAEHWERLETAKSQFLGLASHELRSPLAVLGGYLSMLTEGTFGELPNRIGDILQLLAGKTREMNALVNDMLETARLEESLFGLVAVRTDIRDVVQQVVADWQPLVSEGQRLVLVKPAEQVMVQADPARMRTIVANLIENAIKYSPDGGEIVCSVGCGETEAMVTVRDHGIGIAPESMALLFSRFGRLVTPQTSHIPGTGLGLYIARELARAHGGDVTVESAPGEGSAFTVAFPVQRPIADTDPST